MFSQTSNAEIINGASETALTSRRGETLRVDRGDTIAVIDAPAIVLDDNNSALFNAGSISTTGPTETVRVDANDVNIANQRSGSISAENTGIEITGEDTFIRNDGTISGDITGVNFVNGGESSGTLVNRGVIESDSRALNIGGTDINLLNNSDILGTGDQRNGTVYADATADDYSITNNRRGDIDAGEGNQGAGIALQTGDVDGNTVNAKIVNRGEIDGRGQADSTSSLAGDGIRIFSGTPGGEDEIFKGSISNSGRISSESEQGTTAGIRVADGVGFSGTIQNTNRGLIEGEQNGLYFGNATHDVDAINFGRIESGSRAVNIDGTGVNFVNNGNVLGTGDQRNGTVYTDATADDYSITNNRRGDIDAGEGNQGAGIALQTGDVNGDTVNASIVNRGEIDGRGQADSTSSLAGDGIRIFSGTPGGEDEIFEGSISNSGRISSESEQGTTAGIRVADGVGFSGTIQNANRGLIEGEQNGLYFGNATHDVDAINFGRIESGSRAVNIDGTGVDFVNNGNVLGTGDQRNGTVYADATADDYSITNNRRGDIDAGEGNQGASIALQTGDVDGNTVNARIVNRGEIDGRGQADSTSSLAGDGIRIFSGTPGGEDGIFKGSISNSGRISSESEQGTTAGIRVADGVGFSGTIQNASRGLIEGEQNGLYFGNATHDVDAINFGRIESGSRAVNIDGTGVDFVNNGNVLGTGDQRNGTVYADATADDYSITNNRRGDIDAGEGNQGAGISLQTGDVEGDIVNASIENAGQVTGRGNGEGNQEGDGLRVFAGAADTTLASNIVNSGLIRGSEDGIDIRSGVTVEGDILNSGRVEAKSGAGIEITGSLSGNINNSGRIEGGDVAAINASLAESSVSIDNSGQIVGNILLSAQDDVFVSTGLVDGDVIAGAGNDLIAATNVTGRIDGGDGIDTADFSALEEGATGGAFGGVIIDLDVNSAGAAGTPGQDGGVLTTPPGAVAVGGVVPDSAILQEVDDVENVIGSNFNDGLFGNNEVNILQAGTGNDVIHGFAGDDFLSGGVGTDTVLFSAAPETVVVDLENQVSESQFQDILGGTFDAIFAASDGAGLNVLSGFENVTGSQSDDTIFGDNLNNTLNGNGGNDILNGRGGNNTLIGGEGDDTFVFNTLGESSQISDFQFGEDQINVTAFFDTQADALAASSQTGNDVVIDLDASSGDQITLVGVQLDNLNLGDFVA